MNSLWVIIVVLVSYRGAAASHVTLFNKACRSSLLPAPKQIYTHFGHFSGVYQIGWGVFTITWNHWRIWIKEKKGKKWKERRQWFDCKIWEKMWIEWLYDMGINYGMSLKCFKSEHAREIFMEVLNWREKKIRNEKSEKVRKSSTMSEKLQDARKRSWNF